MPAESSWPSLDAVVSAADASAGWVASLVFGKNNDFNEQVSNASRPTFDDLGDCDRLNVALPSVSSQPQRLSEAFPEVT